MVVTVDDFVFLWAQIKTRKVNVEVMPWKIQTMKNYARCKRTLKI